MGLLSLKSEGFDVLDQWLTLTKRLRVPMSGKFGTPMAVVIGSSLGSPVIGLSAQPGGKHQSLRVFMSESVEVLNKEV